MNQTEQAVDRLKKGEIVAIPTETVYGLAADATNNSAIAKIYELKNRPSFNPLIVHIYSLDQAREIAVFNDKALELAAKHWPGPLTMVLPKRDKSFATLVTAGLDTIALRVPAHPVAREILKSGLMLAAPSANISGKLTPTEASHVKEYFPSIYIVDGGRSEVGLESTVVGFDGSAPVILRHGVLQIGEARENESNKITSPGQLLKHYAPKNPLRINATEKLDGEILIGFGAVDADYNLSANANLIEAAANLFHLLHLVDAKNMKIAVSPIPNSGVGVAINDRLKKASNSI